MLSDRRDSLKYYDEIRAFFLKRGIKKWDAEDLAQDAFARYFERSGEDVFNPRAFLYSIAGNLLADFYRRKNRVVYDSELLETFSEEFDSDEGVFECVRKLPYCERRAVMLKAAGYKSAEAAEIMRLNASTYRNYVQKGRKKLKNLLKNNK